VPALAHPVLSVDQRLAQVLLTGPQAADFLPDRLQFVCGVHSCLLFIEQDQNTPNR